MDATRTRRDPEDTATVGRPHRVTLLVWTLVALDLLVVLSLVLFLYPAAGGAAGDWRHDARIAAFIVAMVALIASLLLLRRVRTQWLAHDARMGALRASEAQLRDSENRYRTLVAAMDEGVLLVDAQGAAIAFNDSAARILGRTREQLASSAPLYELRGTPEADATHAPVGAVPAVRTDSPCETLRTGKPLAGATMSVQRPDGSIAWRAVHAQPVFGAAPGVPTAVVVTLRDITAEGTAPEAALRAHATDILREGERLLAQTETIAKIGSWRLAIGIDGRSDRWMVSEGLRRLFDYPMDEPVTWEAVLDHVDPDARAIVCERFRMGKARGGHATWEHAVAIGGRPGWILCHADFLLDEHGAAWEVRGTVQDITDRKEAEERLRTSERRLGLAADAGAVGLWDIDLATGDAWRSPRHAEIFGEATADSPWSTEKLLSHVVPEDRERIGRCIREGVPGKAVEWESRIVRADGVVRTVAVRGEVVADEAGRHLRALGTVADVTERREAEDILLQQQAVLHTMHEGVVVVQTSGVILLANRKLESMFGYAPGELEGRHVRELNATSDRTPDEIAAAMMQTIVRDGIWSGDVRNVRKDGTIFWCHATVSPLEQRRHGTVLVCVLQDITDRRRTQEALTALNDSLESQVTERTAELRSARDEAEAANRAKSDFLANISHELRTPLHGVLGMTGLALRLATDAKQKRYLETVAAAAAQLGAIIDGILDVVKTDPERVRLAASAFRLAAVVDAIARECAPIARTKGLDFAVALPPALRDLECIGDPLRLSQVLRNLTDNAIKFTESGGVALAASMIEETPDDVLVRFEVRDSGIGVAPELQRRMFEPFQQADTSATRRHGGAGVGLAICRRLAEAMGGSIGVDSEGAGSTFWFTARLPKDAKQDAAATATPPETAEHVLQRDHREKKVLLVEDDVDNRDLALAQLKSVWTTIDCAGDGVEAVERVRAHRYDVILMDMRMPRMDGIEATQHIRALPNGATVPIIAMTANVYHEDRVRCLEVGMNDFIPKAVGGGPPFAILLKWLVAPRAG